MKFVPVVLCLCLCSRLSQTLFLILQLSSAVWIASSSTAGEDTATILLRCLHSQITDHNNLLIHTPNTTSYTTIFQSSAQNQRYNETSQSRKPTSIITPISTAQIQSTILCSRKHNIQIRIRSGGHDYEALSYVSSAPNSLLVPFLLVDLTKMRNVTVDVSAKSAWVQAGAVLGEVYHAIAAASGRLAFPAGMCPTVGIGGHVSGGGYGFLVRKYGMAADNVVDVELVDARGRVLNRASMGEDVFWAIRGGGGNTYGIVVSWKLKLVAVPSRLTAFLITRSSSEEVIKLVDKYQHVVDRLPDELTMLVMLRRGNETTQAIFQALHQGSTRSLVKVLKRTFPELQVTKQDCKEMSWIESVLYFAGYPNNATYDVLLSSRTNSPIPVAKLKGKSDYIERPLPLKALKVAWRSLTSLKVVQGVTFLHLIPHGGIMSRISNSSTPYPRRAGTIYKIQYNAIWWGEEKDEVHLEWIRKLYKFMTPYVSKNPRSAYPNTRDLDLGVNNPGNNSTSYEQARVWGDKYFAHNFERLARIKAAIDLTNFFRNEQSVPPLINIL